MALQGVHRREQSAGEGLGVPVEIFRRKANACPLVLLLARPPLPPRSFEGNNAPLEVVDGVREERRAAPKAEEGHAPKGPSVSKQGRTAPACHNLRCAVRHGALDPPVFLGLLRKLVAGIVASLYGQLSRRGSSASFARTSAYAVDVGSPIAVAKLA